VLHVIFKGSIDVSKLISNDSNEDRLEREGCCWVNCVGCGEASRLEAKRRGKSWESGKVRR